MEEEPEETRPTALRYKSYWHWDHPDTAVVEIYNRQGDLLDTKTYERREVEDLVAVFRKLLALG